MMTILEHVSLAQLRACKNRTSLHFALQRATRPRVHAALHRDIQHAYAANITLITQLDDILNLLGHAPGPTQP